MLRGSCSALLSVILVAAFVGCASDGGVETSAAFDPLTRFPAQATYQWDESRIRLPEDDRIAALDLKPVIMEAAEAEFALRGYTRSTTDEANYLMSFEGTTHSWIGADNSRAVGSLSILLVDAANGRRVWMGIGRSEMNVGVTRAERLVSLRAAIAEMLKNFPPNQPR